MNSPGVGDGAGVDAGPDGPNPLPSGHGVTEPYYTDATVTVWAGDCLDVLPTLPDNSVDCVVTDPPYGLEFMGKDWDRFRTDDPGTNRHRGERAGAQGTKGTTDQRWTGADGRSMPSSRVNYGGGRRPTTNQCTGCGKRDQFRSAHTCPTGTPWESVILNPHAAPPTSLAFQAWCELWAAECLRILKPGGHLLAFGGTRTSHRLVSGIEDAGFEIRDSKVWLYGSGFPKSLNVGRAIDGMFCREAGTHVGDPEHVCPTTPQGDEWRAWGTALKPGHEPICVARKPLVGTVAANVLAYGTGALNIDACRIGTEQTRTIVGKDGFGQNFRDDGWQPEGTLTYSDARAGRWPANVVLDESQAAALDQMSGELTSGSRQAGEYGLMGYQGSDARPMPEINGDSGGASRFFYTAKASTDERITHDGTAHPTVKPLSLMRWLVRLVCSPGGTILDPFAGSGATVEAALLEGFRCIAIEREADYLPMITQRINRRRDPIAYITAAGEDLGLFADLAESDSGTGPDLEGSAASPQPAPGPG